MEGSSFPFPTWQLCARNLKILLNNGRKCSDTSCPIILVTGFFSPVLLIWPFFIALKWVQSLGNILLTFFFIHISTLHPIAKTRSKKPTNLRGVATLLKTLSPWLILTLRIESKVLSRAYKTSMIVQDFSCLSQAPFCFALATPQPNYIFLVPFPLPLPPHPLHSGSPRGDVFSSEK